MTTTILASFPSPSQGVWHIEIPVIGSIPIRAYALCIIAGIVAALVIGDRRWAARGGQRGVIYDIALWAVPFGLVGGRLYHVMTDWPTYFGPGGYGFLAALRIWDGGLGIWGAVALGAVGAWIGCRQRGIPLPAFGDAIAPGIILAQAIGRLGNYFNQELYGGPTDLPWGLEIFYRVNPVTGEPDKLNGVSTGQLLESAPSPVHPTFLYELLWNLLVFAVLLWADRRFRLGHGRLFALYVAGYCVGRFCIELIRQDHASLIAGIRVNTFTSAIVFLGAVLHIVVATKGREAPETLWGKSPEDAEAEKVGAAQAARAPVAAGVGSAAAGSVVAAQGAGASIDAPVGGLGSVEGDDVTAAEDDAAKVHGDAAAQAEEAEATAADVAAEPPGTEPREPDELDSSVDEAVPEGGLGSVEGDDVTAAEDDAAQVHDDAAAQAEATAADVAAEPSTPADEQPTGDESATAVGASAADDDAAESHDDATARSEEDDVSTQDADESNSTVHETVPEAGLGSVDADDVTGAEDDAAQVHDDAAAQAAEAQATADDVADEPSSGSADEPDSTADDDVTTATADDTAEPSEAEPLTATNELDSTVGEAVPEAGLGSVDADDVTAAEDDAAQVHDDAAAQAAEAEATADDVADEPAADTAAESPGPSRRRWWRRGS